MSRVFWLTLSGSTIALALAPNLRLGFVQGIPFRNALSGQCVDAGIRWHPDSSDRNDATHLFGCFYGECIVGVPCSRPRVSAAEWTRSPRGWHADTPAILSIRTASAAETPAARERQLFQSNEINFPRRK